MLSTENMTGGAANDRKRRVVRPRLHTAVVEYLLEDIGKDAGLTKHLSFAMCRWTCFVKDYVEGVPLEVIRSKMGVSQVQWREIFNKIKVLSDTYTGKAEQAA